MARDLRLIGAMALPFLLGRMCLGMGIGVVSVVLGDDLEVNDCLIDRFVI
jgi:hypothetical protein